MGKVASENDVLKRIGVPGVIEAFKKQLLSQAQNKSRGRYRRRRIQEPRSNPSASSIPTMAYGGLLSS